MHADRSAEQPRKKAAPISSIAVVVIFAFAITLTSVAQQAAPAPAPVAAAQNNAQKVQIKAQTIPALKAGVPMAFNLCNGTDVTNQLPAKFTDAQGLAMDTKQTPCGEQQSTSQQVSGGNPPYSFQWSSGGFPPLGMHLGSNGLLYGTPAPHIGGYPPFQVCAVDMSGNQGCREVTIGTQPAAQQAAAHSNAPLILGLLAAGGVAAVVGAREMSSASSSSSSGGDSAGQCDGFGSTTNACGPCTCGGSTSCTDSPQCGGGQCFNYAQDNNQTAPFCGK
jgi:hypothetical protein